MTDEEKYISVLKNLTKDGKALAEDRPIEMSAGKSSERNALAGEGKCYEWFVKGREIIKNILGENSNFYRDYVSFYHQSSISTRPAPASIPSFGVEYGTFNYSFLRPDLEKQVAILNVILYQLENTGLKSIYKANRIEMSNEVLEEAQNEFLNDEFYNIAAICGRIVMQNLINEYAKQQNIQYQKRKFSAVIVELKDKGIITKSFWKELDAKYTLGNEAAHKLPDEFKKEYSKKDVENMFSFIENTIIQIIK